MKEYLWTSAGGRLQYQSAQGTSAVNWLFLPGGPGLGSEALADLTGLLKDKIPGVIWHFDLPNDGSNLLKDKSLSNWRAAITQAVTAFEKVVLVAHSTPGMYVQTMPQLENLLHGLVLIGSAPDASWQKSLPKEIIEPKNDDELRKLLIASAHQCFVTDKSLEQGKELFKRIPVNNRAHELSSKIFDVENYKATFIPKHLKTLIITGSSDHITPSALFKNNPLYQRENILIREIPQAGHYPWFENPKEVAHAFQDFSRKT